MLSFELIKKVQNYINIHFTGDETDKHNIPGMLISPSLSNNLDLPIVNESADSFIAGTGYNPDNDSPIPSFLKDNSVVFENETPKTSRSVFTKLRDMSCLEFEESESDDTDEQPILAANTMLTAAGSIRKRQSTSDIIPELEKKLQNADISFGELLTQEIDARGLTDADCYKKAQLNRSHFNKIKNDPSYNIQKETVFALALALSLNKAEADEFLSKAGFAFAANSKMDLIVEFCISNGIYDVIEVNQILYAFDQKLLGAGVRE